MPNLPRLSRFVLAGAVVTLLLPAVSGCAHRSERPPVAVELVTGSEEEAIHITQTGDEALVDIQKAQGIGTATFSVAAKPKTRRVLVRLHLHGLEELRLTGAEGEWVVSVLSHSGNPILQTFNPSGALGVKLTPQDALWLTLRIAPTPGQAPTIPLQDGWFELTLPDALVVPGSDFSLRWIDFHR